MIALNSIKMAASFAIFFMLFSSVSIAKGKPKINIHPSDVNEDGITLTSEANIYANTLYMTDTLAYSSSSGFDVSVSSQNIPIMGGGAQNYQDDTYLNLSYTAKLADGHATTIGTQTGYQLYQQPVGKIHLFDFIDHEYTVNQYVKLHSGSFWVNSALSTMTSYVGGMAGIKVNYGDWMVQADYFGGHTNVSGGVFNLNYYWLPSIATYIGIGIPERWSGNEFYGIVGVSLSTTSLR